MLAQHVRALLICLEPATVALSGRLLSAVAMDLQAFPDICPGGATTAHAPEITFAAELRPTEHADPAAKLGQLVNCFSSLAPAMLALPEIASSLSALAVQMQTSCDPHDLEGKLGHLAEDTADRFERIEYKVDNITHMLADAGKGAGPCSSLRSDAYAGHEYFYSCFFVFCRFVFCFGLVRSFVRSFVRS